MKYTIIFLFFSTLTFSQDSTSIPPMIPAQSIIVRDSTGFRVLSMKDRQNYNDAFIVHHSHLLDSATLELYLFNMAIRHLAQQEDSTRYYQLATAYQEFTGQNLTSTRDQRVISALQGPWTITRHSDNREFHGQFTGSTFKIGQQTAIVTVETSRSIKITGLNIGDLYLDAINRNKLVARNKTVTFIRD